MSERPDIEAIRKRADAATEGRWFWEINLKGKQARLVSDRNGHEVVMDFVRWGMSGATPRFRNNSCVMDTAECWSATVEGREHHEAWYRTITHPDAEFIRHAKEDIPSLLAYIDDLEHRLGVEAKETT